MQSLNAFNQSATKGLSTHNLGSAIPVIIDDAETGILVPGQKVKLSNADGKKIVVVAIENDTDEIFGVIPYIRGIANFKAGDALEILIDTAVVYLEAGAAINRGARVMPVILDNKVITATTGKSIAGICLDKSLADGDLVRVMLTLFLPKAV